MKRVETGSKLIYTFEDVLDTSVCAAICDKLSSLTKDNQVSFSEGIMPWQQNDRLQFIDLEKGELRKQIHAYLIKTSALIMQCYNEIAYPIFTDMVLWRPGRNMGEHKDNGYNGEETLTCRHFSTVTYCNDNYLGGETFIRNEHGGYYVSQPKTGSLVIFLSDERCAHGVNSVALNNRITLSTWFTKDIKYFNSQEKESE